MRRAEQVDDMVTALVTSRLTKPDARELFAGADSRHETRALREEAAGLRTRLDGLSEAYAQGDIDRDQLRAGSQRLKARLGVVMDDLAALAVTPVVAALLETQDVAAAWKGLDLDRQRSVVGTLMEVVLHSPGRGARTFDPASVGITWRTDGSV